jgi:hypothetical protein
MFARGSGGGRKINQKITKSVHSPRTRTPPLRSLTSKGYARGRIPRSASVKGNHREVYFTQVKISGTRFRFANKGRCKLCFITSLLVRLKPDSAGLLTSRRTQIELTPRQGGRGYHIIEKRNQLIWQVPGLGVLRCYSQLRGCAIPYPENEND